MSGTDLTAAAAGRDSPNPADREEDQAPGAAERRGWVLAAAVLATVLPLFVAAVALARRGWVPVGEYAQAELRVRDFWAHPPSLGAVGRLRTESQVSSHPGPAAWWAMYPVYALFGRSAAALSLSVATVAAAWVAAALTLLWRRAGDAVTALAAIVILALIAALGPVTFVEPWNPWFAVMAFLCALVAAWDVAGGHPWSLVWLVAAGSFAAQAHVGYAPLVAALVLAGIAGLLLAQRRSERPWVRLALPAGVAAGTVLAMWALPLLEQLRNDPGNLSVLMDAYGAQAEREPYLGLGGAVRLTGAYLDVAAPVKILEDLRPAERDPGPGTLVLLCAWGLAAFVAVKRRHEPSMRQVPTFHAITAVGVAAGVLAASRIVGEVYGYLILWLGVLVAAVVLAILWTAWVAFCERPGRVRSVLGWAVAVVLGLGCLATSVGFADPVVPAEQLESVTAELVPLVADRLDPERSYVLRWDDPLAFGAIGTGLLSELERRGFTVGVDDRLRTEMRTHRVVEPGESDAALWVVTGAAIDRWRELPDARELAVVDPRSPAEREEARREHDEIEHELRRIGGEELAAGLDRNYWVTRSDPRVPDELSARIDALAALGLPTAVFLAGPDTPQP